MKKRTWLFFLMIIGTMLLCLYFSKCDTGTTPEPVKPDTLDCNINFILRFLNGDSSVIGIKQRHIMDNNQFYFDSTLIINMPIDTVDKPVPGPVVHDTTTVRDTLYLPEWQTGDRKRISFGYKDDRQVRFGVQWSSDSDTCVQFGLFPTYAPWDAPDSMVTFERDFQYCVEIGGAEYVDTLIVDGIERRRLWKTVSMQIVPYNYWGVQGIPSLPYHFVHWEYLK